MANTKSAAKRARIALVRAQRNAAVKSSVRTAIKKVLTSAAQNGEAAVQQLQTAATLLDKAVSKGVIHKNTAARKKSRLAKKVAAAQTAQA